MAEPSSLTAGGDARAHAPADAQALAEAALRESEARKAAILDTALDGIVLMSHEGRIVDFNPAAERMFQRRRAEVIGQDMAEIIIPARLREMHRRGLARYLATGAARILGQHVETEALRADGTEFPVELSIVAIAGAAPPLFAGHLRDITARKAAEQALRESSERFRNLADNIAQLAWMADERGWIFWYNKRWLEYTGATLEEMQGAGWERVHHPEHIAGVREKWRRHLRAGEVWEDTFPLRGKDGSFRWFLSRAMPIRDESGRVVRWFGTNTDITEQRELTEQLALAKEKAEAASRAKDEFLAALSHELRTPLTPVLMTAAELERDESLAPPLRENLGMMRRNVELEARLIDDLLDLTRIARGRLPLHRQPVDAHSLLLHTLEIVRSEYSGKEIQIAVELEAAQPFIQADPARMQQVFWNLLKNALKFTEAHGRVAVRTFSEGARLAVVVSDTGIGIEPDALGRIFQAFDQGTLPGDHRFGGLGLGLSISKAIVDLHGGELRAESAGAGRGATFTVMLETTKAPEPADIHHPVAPEAARSLRLLLVEDHEATLAVTARLLRARGHEVHTAATSAAAREIARAEELDFVVSDLGLPDASGLDLMRHLRDAHGLRGIALSGYGMDEDVRKSIEAGFAAHLTKPVEVSRLDQALAELAAGDDDAGQPTAGGCG